MFLRENTRKISIGNLTIGGSDKITVQSMTNTDTRDSAATIRQIRELEEAGCDIVRVASSRLLSSIYLKKYAYANVIRFTQQHPSYPAR